MATWFNWKIVQRQKPLTLEKRLVGSLNQQVFKQMQSLLNKLNTNIIEVIEIDDKSKANNVNVDKGNSTGTNDDIIMQLQPQSNQNKYDMEDVVLNDHDMLSNEVLDIE